MKTTTQEEKIKIIKADSERVHPDKEEFCHMDHAYLIKFANGKFWYKELAGVTEIHQDKYMICHDIISDMFFNQVNGNTSAYTSSSRIAGHHNMNESGTLIFWAGEPVYVFDNPENEEQESEFFASVEHW